MDSFPKANTVEPLTTFQFYYEQAFLLAERTLLDYSSTYYATFYFTLSSYKLSPQHNKRFNRRSNVASNAVLIHNEGINSIDHGVL